MNTNVSESGSLYGKMMAILVVALFALSSFTAMVSASDDVDEVRIRSANGALIQIERDQFDPSKIIFNEDEVW